MPIKPENKKRYPANWLTEIRPRILARAGNKCEFCGVHNYARGFRDFDGTFVDQNDIAHWAFRRIFNPKLIKIVLTIMHLDHTPENCVDENLKAGCQRCHNRYDQQHRLKNRRATNAAAKI